MLDPFKTLFDELPIMLVVHYDGKISFLNKAAKQLQDALTANKEGLNLSNIVKNKSGSVIEFFDFNGKSNYLSIDSFPIEWRGMHAQCSMLEMIDVQVASQMKKVVAFETDAKQTRSRFLAAISHEMRTPLNALINLGFLMKTTDLDKNQNEIIDISYSSAKELLDRIEDVLEFSQLESERIQPSLEPIIIANEIEPVLGELETEALNKGIELEVEIAPALLNQYNAAGSALRRLIRHLGENAVHYTYDGKVSISLDVGEDGEGVFIKVEDTGEGIDPERLNNIFRPFDFNQDPVNRVNGGLSIGLSLSRAIARSLGGELSINSELGKGTIASAYLPFTPVNAQQDASQDIKSALHILVAEDNRTNQKVLSMILSQLGHTCVCVDDGNKCVEILENQSFDLILMDLHMPFKDGYEATIDIRKRNTETPIIALTADAREDARLRALHCGMNGFITKPLIVAELDAAINEFGYPHDKENKNSVAI